MRIIITDRPGKVAVEDMRSAFEQAIEKTDVLREAHALVPVEVAGRFSHYKDESTDLLWIGFALATRYRQQSGEAMLNWPPHGATNLLGAEVEVSKADCPVFRPDGSKLFLMILGGARHFTAIVPGPQIADCYLKLIGGVPAHMSETDIRAWLEDSRNWAHDPMTGPCRYSEEIDERTTIDLVLLDSFAIMGAIASSVDAPNPVPECPFSHVLHPDVAGPDPILIYAYLPPSHIKLGYKVVDSSR